jgi:hypothetical protein
MEWIPASDCHLLPACGIDSTVLFSHLKCYFVCGETTFGTDATAQLQPVSFSSSYDRKENFHSLPPSQSHAQVVLSFVDIGRTERFLSNSGKYVQKKQNRNNILETKKKRDPGSWRSSTV